MLRHLPSKTLNLCFPPAAAIQTGRYAGYVCVDPERRKARWAHLLCDFNRIGQGQGMDL
jgi:hypothetical protein